MFRGEAIGVDCSRISGLAQQGDLTNWSNWRAAIVLGSSSYSTVISQLAAAQVMLWGRVNHERREE
jgi:hypothetical protein